MKRIEGKRQEGAALLVVLMVVMAVTILSLGFLSRSDVELACGENMILRTQMDYLAESGLEHARGLILNPQDVDSEFWTGDVGQQIASGNDYYDVNVTWLGQCNYRITSSAYRQKDGEEVGRSSLTAELRLDPCIAYWVETSNDQQLSSAVTVNGDVYCGGNLKNFGAINGDVFANSLSGSITGQHKAVGDLSLDWPRVTVEDFTSKYPVQTIYSTSLSGETFGPYNPVRVCHRAGDLELAGNVQIESMLVVDGDLTIRGVGNVITAEKNLPALLVSGDVIIEGGGKLDVYGLAVVKRQMQISAGAASVNVLGGLFTEDDIVETTADSSGNGNNATLYNDPTWHPTGGQTGGAVEFDGVDDRVEDAGASSYLNGLSAITVSLWVKSDVTYQDRGILFTSDPTSADEELGIRYDKSGASGGGVKGIKASIRTTSGYTQIESASYVQTTAWQHLALVWESGSALKLYIDGKLDPLRYDMGPLSGTVSGVQKLMLGRGTKDKYWDGLIDDVRIYNRTLDANDIYPPTDGLAGLVGHWKLDEGGIGNITITAAPSKTAVVVWSQEGVEEKWGQAAGAFFRSIER